ncbi:integrase [Pseudomonas fulva]|uniref:Integrase n=1 Tax=Pseudomonas fulva TaxID=47880 RepID=A0A7S9L6U2_9PSED|nr:integrase [Pseudomonas fulva]QPH43554.1 integrase [Pseudomonas fulva]QPH48633.1 integrase [Pseudomonas fulva]
MSNLFHFTSRAELSAQENLKEFIDRCRNELTVFGKELDFDAWLWPKAANFTKLGSGSRSTSIDDKMAEPFISFAKAYFRYQQGHNPTGTKNETKALKVLEKVLTELHGQPDILKLNSSVLDQAALLAREYYTAVAYQCGRELQRLAKFVSENGLIPVSCATWVNPIARPDSAARTGKKASEAREKKLPHPDAVLALADIFANVTDDPRDIFTTSVFALLMSGSVRISEVLSLPNNCEVHDVDKYGDPVYRIGYFSGKGFGANLKPVPTVMVPIVQEALKRIRTITEEGRALGKWLEANPDQMFIHPDFRHKDRTKILTEVEACEALGFGLPAHEAKQRMYHLYGFKKGDFITLDALWDKLKDRVDKKFPVVSEKAGVNYGDALFAMQQNRLHAQRGTLRVLPWLPSVNIVNNDLSPRESLEEGAHTSIFARYGFRHSDGSEMKITTHQMRHMIDTMGHRGGLSEDDIARFAGRADPKQNRVYNHLTPKELAAKYEAVQLAAGYDQSVLIHCEPVSREAYELAPKGPVHRSRYGFCLHDFAAAPCGQFRDCLNCNEHLCEKRPDTKEEIESQLADIEEQLAASEAAMNEGHYGADRWYEHHSLSAARMRELVGILKDDSVPEGSFIRLRRENQPSHSARALRARGEMLTKAISEEPSNRLANLMEMM